MQSDAQTYAKHFSELVDGDFPLMGHVDIQDTHEKVIVPYIEKLVGNLKHRFSDTAGQISVASNIFTPSAVSMKEEQLGKICALAKYFGRCEEEEEVKTISMCRIPSKHDFIFIFPEKDEMWEHDVTDIIMKLPEPIRVSGTARSSKQFKFLYGLLCNYGADIDLD